jgi:hypothetical protein
MAQASFILSVFDLNLWCTVLECRFVVDDVAALGAIINADLATDPDFNGIYTIDADELHAINQRFGTDFQPEATCLAAFEIGLERQHRRIGQGSLREVPYLVHTNFELPLMIDGRKKLARLSGGETAKAFGEDAFDVWVQKGLLHKQVIFVPIPDDQRAGLVDPSVKGYRNVYYTLKGEEWRIPAMELLWKAFERGSGWSDDHERMEGMLYGYDDAQNDWWIKHRRALRDKTENDL